MLPINPRVFKAYDIRGVVGRDFDPDWVERLGQAVGAYFRGRDLPRAVVGHDCRHSSPGYADRLAAGMAASGVDVILIGMVPTPVLYFACLHLGTNAGVIVTASHNPPEYNGFKIVAGASTIHGEAIQEVRRLMEAGDFPADRQGLVSRHDVVPSYLDDLLAKVTVERPVKVVVDGGNGAGGLVTAELLRRAGCEVTELFCEPDGDFPNHHPDPVLEENAEALRKLVVEGGYDVGIGLDGDCDRIGAVDETGRLMFGDRLLAIYSRELLARRPGATILADVKCSHLLFRDIEAHGGRAIMSATGHSLMKAAMVRDKGALGGEMSGHMFFADRFYGFDDASYSALRLVEILGKAGAPSLSRQLADWPETFVTSEIRLDVPEGLAPRVVAKAVAYFRERFDVIDIDGVRIVFPDGWALMRSSNTQPVIVMRFEAETRERLAAIREMVEAKLKGWITEG